MTWTLWLVACQKSVAPNPAIAAVDSLDVAAVQTWRTSVEADHVLVGRIWNVSTGTFVDQATLMQRLAGAPVVMLGEKHDNPDHHALQGRIIAELSPKAVAFEMLDHADPIGEATDASSLAVASGWDASGWPPFAIYSPVFEAVYAAGAKVIAAHPTRDEVRSVMGTGYEALPETDRVGLKLDGALTDADKAELAEEIVASHCGHANEAVVSMMIRGQVLKDAWMARCLVNADKPVVLVAGGGHTRVDRGVPAYLDVDVVNVLMVEVRAGETDPKAYDEGANYLWFTPRVDNVDPCEKFRDQLEKMGKAQPLPAPAPAPAEPTP